MKTDIEFIRYHPSQVDHPDVQQLVSSIYGDECSSPLSRPHETTPKHLEGFYVGYSGQFPFGKFALYENPDLIYHGQKAICLGSYECLDSQELSQALLDHAFQRARNLGYQMIIGPMEGSTWNSHRFVGHWHEPRFFTEPVHKDYYLNQFLASGFEPLARFHSQIGDIPQDLGSVEDIRQRFDKYHLTPRHVIMDNWEDELRKIAEFTIEQFSRNFLYTPISPEEFVEKYLPLKILIDPSLILLTEDKNQKIKGLCFMIRDHLSEDPPQVIIKTLARDRMERYKGLGNLLVAHQYAIAVKLGFQRVIHAFMKDDNASLRLSHEYYGEAYRNYFLLRKSI